MCQIGDIVYARRNDNGKTTVGIVIRTDYGDPPLVLIRCQMEAVRFSASSGAVHTHQLMDPEYGDMMSAEEYIEWQTTIDHYHQAQ